MGTNIFDPYNDTLPDFCRDVLGQQNPTPEAPQVITPIGKTMQAFVFGVFLGLFPGFLLGVFDGPRLISELWR